jgi:hypothetical protein
MSEVPPETLQYFHDPTPLAAPTPLPCRPPYTCCALTTPTCGRLPTFLFAQVSLALSHLRDEGAHEVVRHWSLDDGHARVPHRGRER